MFAMFAPSSNAGSWSLVYDLHSYPLSWLASSSCRGFVAPNRGAPTLAIDVTLVRDWQSLCLSRKVRARPRGISSAFPMVVQRTASRWHDLGTKGVLSDHTTGLHQKDLLVPSLRCVMFEASERQIEG